MGPSNVPVQNQPGVQPYGTVMPQAQVQNVNPISMPIQNPIQNQSSSNFNSNQQQQVFQVDQTAILTTLQLMMEEMRSWRNQPSISIQPNLRPQAGSQGSQAPQQGWGLPSIQNQSQYQSQSQ